MVHDIEKLEKCPLCGSGLKIPQYRCRKCAKDYEKTRAIISKDGRARCPECNSFLKGLSLDDVREDITCKECGITINEMNILTERKIDEKEAKSKKKLTSLEDKLEILSKEIDKILSDSDDEEMVEEYLCPSCGTEIDLHCDICPKCGMEFFEVEEVPEGFELEDDDFLECSECKAKVDSDAIECPKCGMVFAGEDLFACPTCDQVVDSKTTVCPKCKTEFVPFDKELESALDNLMEYNETDSSKTQEEEPAEDAQFSELMQILVEPEEGVLEPELQKRPELAKPREKPYHSQTVVRQVMPKPSESYIKQEEQRTPITITAKEEKKEEYEKVCIEDSKAFEEERQNEFYPEEPEVISEFEQREEFIEKSNKIKEGDESLSKRDSKGLKTTGNAPFSAFAQRVFEKQKPSTVYAKRMPIGITTGLTNGVSRGIAGGFTNGLTNGLRAIRAGITNGLTNGNGITNGLKPRDRIIDSKRGKIKLIVVPIVILLFVFSPYIMVNFNPKPEGITIDGTFGDWRGVTTSMDFQEGVPFNPNVDIVNYKVDFRNLELSLYLEVDGIMLAGEPGGERHVDTAYIFMDIDSDLNTGYFIKDLGADYMLEVYGWDGRVKKSYIYSYASNTQDWRFWEKFTSVACEARGSALEAQIPFQTLFLKKDDAVGFLFYMQSYNGFEDFSDTLISTKKGVLSVIQQGVAEDVVQGLNNRILMLNLEAMNNEVVINRIDVQRIGKGNTGDLDSVRIEDSSGNLIVQGTQNSDLVSFQPSLRLSAGQKTTLYVVIDVAANAISGNSVGFLLRSRQDVNCDAGSVSLARQNPDIGQNEVTYLIDIPSDVKIDGAFADWKGKTIFNDTLSDGKRPSEDIIKYGASNTDEKIAFFLEVNEDICGGVKVPYFNNQKISEPIISEGPGGGPGPELPPLTGEDVVYIFIDTISQKGYHQGLPFGADFMIRITGRYNTILSRSYFEWTGSSSNEWKWSNSGPVEVALDFMRMEAEVTFNSLRFNPQNDHFNVYFITTDWNELHKDFSDREGMISGPTRGLVVNDGTRGYDMRYHGTYDAYYEMAAKRVLFETQDATYLRWSLPPKVNLQLENGDSITIASLIPSDFEISSDMARWRNTYSDYAISVEHIFGLDTLKENMVINQRIPPPLEKPYPDYLTMDIQLDYSKGLNIFIKGEEDQGGIITSSDIEFYSGKDKIITIKGPYAMDANQNEVQCEYVYLDSETPHLRLRCPYSWLEKAAYPVAIDPSVKYTLENDHPTWDDDLGDGLGDAVAVGDFNGDGYADVAAGAPSDEGGDGAVYVFLGPFSGDDDIPDVKLDPSTGNQNDYGGALAVGNFNNDAYDDIAVGGNGGSAPPDVFIFYGSSSFSGLITTPNVRVPRITNKYYFAFSLATGDFNPGTDSYDDLLVGVLNWNNGNSDDNGRVLIYLYDSSDWGDGTVNDSPDGYLVSEDKGKEVWEFGYSIAVGNMYSPTNCDDIVVGERFFNKAGGQSDDGRIYIFNGNSLSFSGAENTATQTINSPGNTDAENFGTSVAVGDLNPDDTTNDYDDILAGAPRNNEQGIDSGRAYYFLAQDVSGGGFTGSSVVDIPNPGNDKAGDYFGNYVIILDYESDGNGDSIVSGIYNGSGTVYRFDGDSIICVEDFDYSQSNERYGLSIAGGKYTNDDEAILAIGAPNWVDLEEFPVIVVFGAGRVEVIRVAEFNEIVPPMMMSLVIFAILSRRYRFGKLGNKSAEKSGKATGKIKFCLKGLIER